MNTIAQIFLSYAREDEEKVANLYQKLCDAGFTPWMDTKDIQGGEKWESCIKRAIKACDFFVACLSLKSLPKRGILREEQEFALNLQQAKDDGAIFTIPLRLEECPLPRHLNELQCIDYFESDGFERLVKTLKGGNAQSDDNRLTHVDLKIKMQLSNFDHHYQTLLQNGLAKFLAIPSEDIKMLKYEKGCVKVTLELPANSAEKLLTAFERKNLELAKHLAPLSLLNVSRTRNQREKKHEKRASSKLFEAQLRHAKHYESLLRSANELYQKGGDGLKTGLELFDLEWCNIQAGQEWARIHTEKGNVTAQLCSDYPDAGTYCLDLRLTPKDRIDWREAGVNAARRIKRRSAEGVHLGHIGVAYAVLGELGRAIEYYDKALSIAREVNDHRNAATWLGDLGLAYSALGDPRRAIQLYQQALVIVREIGNRRDEGSLLGSLGSAYYYLGNFQQAINLYKERLAISREIGDRRGEGNALGNLGIAYAALGQIDKAVTHYKRQLAISREIGDRRVEGQVLGNLGIAFKNLGEHSQALDSHKQSLAIAREIGDRRMEGSALGNLGLAYFTMGKIHKAIEYYEQRLGLAREIGDRRGEAAVLGNLGMTYVEQGNTQKAVLYYEQSLEIARKIGDHRYEGNALMNTGYAHFCSKDHQRAFELYQQAFAIFQQIGDRRGMANTLYYMSLSEIELGKWSRAVANAEAALNIYEKIKDPHADEVRELLAEWRANKSKKGWQFWK